MSFLNQLIGSLKFNNSIKYLAGLGALGKERFNLNKIQNLCFQRKHALNFMINKISNLLYNKTLEKANVSQKNLDKESKFG